MLHKLLILERPLAVFDLETTGIDPRKDRIIQMGITMYYPDKDPIKWKTLVNPGIPIKNTGTSHKISDEHVKNAPMFKELAPQIAKQVLDVDLAGHNAARFDYEMLKAEMARAQVPWPWNGHIIDTLAICRLKNPHTLANAVKQFVDEEIAQLFGLSTNEEDFHDAGNDVAASSAVLYGQLIRYADLPRTVKDLAAFCANKNPNAIDESGKIIWVNGEAVVDFGKWKGIPLKRVDKGYLVWAINSGNFPDDVVVIFGNALKGIYPTK